MTADVLTIRDVNVVYSRPGLFKTLRSHAVRDATLSVAAGEIFALIGESGSGKTSLLRAIAGLVPASGSARVEGREIVGRGASELRSLRARIGFMFQDPVGSLPPRMRVSEIVTEPFRIHGVKFDKEDEVSRLLALVSLPLDLADRFPNQLSGGQARRVGVARALALSPSLILADEPTAGLDVSVQGELLNLLKELQEKMGLSVLIITHNLHVVRHVADRIAIMLDGRIVEQGLNEDLFKGAKHPFTKKLLDANLHV